MEKTYVVINIQKNIKRHDFVNLGSKAVFDPFKAQICEARGVVLTSRAFSLSQVVVSIHIWLCAKITKERVQQQKRIITCPPLAATTRSDVMGNLGGLELKFQC